MSKKTTRRAMLTSVVALALCFAMLIGTTYAWFTDTVTSGNNRIVAGNLKIDLLMYKQDAGATTYSYQSIADGTGDIFDAASIAQNANATLWEPGKTQIVYLGIKNDGNLALKYNVWLNISNVAGAPSMVQDGYSALEYAIIDGVKGDDPSYGYAQLSSLDWVTVKTAAENAAAASAAQIGDITIGQTRAAENGVLDEVAYDASRQGENAEVDYFALAVHMKEDAGNTFQNAAVNIDVHVVAGQFTAEDDSFDNTYDDEAIYEQIPSTSALVFADGSDDHVVIGVDPSFTGDTLIITDGITGIAANAFNGNDTIKTISLPESITEIGENAFANMDQLENITMRGDVTVNQGAFSFSTIDAATTNPVTITYEGNAIFNGTVNYTNYSSSTNGTLVFKGDVTFNNAYPSGYNFVFANIGTYEFRGGGVVKLNEGVFYGTRGTLVFYDLPGAGSVIENCTDGESDLYIQVSDLAAWTAAGYPTTYNGHPVTEIQ